MKTIRLLFLFAVFALVVQAQDKLEAFDTSGKIFKIDKTLEKKIKVFDNYQPFSEARLYQTPDSLFYVEISTGTGNNIIKYKKVLNPSAKDSLVVKITELIAQKSPNSFIDQSGKTLLLTSNTILGLYYYGPVSGALINYDNPGSYVTSSLVAGGAGFLLPYLLTNNKEITEAEAYSSFYFQTRGIAYGWMLPYLVASPDNSKPGMYMSLATSLAGGILGYKVAKDQKLTSEHVLTMGVYGDYGLLNGLSASHWLGFNDSKYAEKLVPLTMLATSAIGLVVGNKIAQKGYYTQGDASLLSSSAIMGAYLPFSLMTAFSPENDKLYSFVASLGSIGGLYIGDKLAKKYELSSRQGIIISLAQLAGGLTGFGLGSVFHYGEPNEINAVTAGLGALAGMYFVTKSYTKDKNLEDKNLSLNFNFNPMGLATLKSSNSVPMFTAQIRFK